MKRLTLILTLGTLLAGVGQAQMATGRAAPGQAGANHMQMPPAVVPKSGAASPAVKALKLTQGWVSAAPPGAQELSAYLALSNPGKVAVTLTGLDTAISHRATLMRTGKDSAGRGTMTMTGSWKIPAGGTLEILPGSGHLMLRQLKRQPQPGETVNATLHFSDGSVLPLKLPVKRFP